MRWIYGTLEKIWAENKEALDFEHGGWTVRFVKANVQID